MQRIGIVVVAYNAARTLAAVLDRIPEGFAGQLHEVLVCDDHSTDTTHRVSETYRGRSNLPITVVRHPENLGYGGNQKSGYRHALERGWDVAVLLHGDGQYAPEALPRMVEPIVQGRTEVVIGSRMMRPGSARAGGMPLYKYVGNRVLSAVQSRFTGLELSEWHSGYRAYAVRALRQVDFESNSNGFDFDTEITLQLHSAGCRFEEIAIPTFYGNEVCHVDGVRYAADVLLDTARFTRDRAGLGSGRFAQEPQRFDPLDDPNGTHSTIAAWAAGRPPTHVLDLGCPNGHLRELMEKAGHRVTAVSAATTNDPFDASDGGTENGSGRGISELTGIGDEHFGLIICRQPTAGRPRDQWLEHLREVRWRLEPGGRVIVDTPVRALHEKPSSLLTVTELRRTVSAAGMEISRIAVPEPAAADAALGGPLRATRATRAMWPELRPRSAARHVVAELRSVV